MRMMRDAVRGGNEDRGRLRNQANLEWCNSANGLSVSDEMSLSVCRVWIRAAGFGGQLVPDSRLISKHMERHGKA